MSESINQLDRLPTDKPLARRNAGIRRRVATSLAELHARFLQIRGRIETHARVYYRHVKCWFTKADFVAETVALAWKWFRQLAMRGKDAREFASALASFAAKAVRCGRRVTGQLKPKDVLSERARQRHGFSVSKLPDFSTLDENPLQEALIDNTVTPPDEQAAFRIDFPAWVQTRSRRDRRLIGDMMTGQRTGDLARKYGLSAPRVSQLRREYHDDWLRYCEEVPCSN